MKEPSVNELWITGNGEPRIILEVRANSARVYDHRNESTYVVGLGHIRRNWIKAEDNPDLLYGQKVYVVTFGNLDDTEILSVHASAAGAERMAEAHRRRCPGGASVEQYEVLP